MSSWASNPKDKLIFENWRSYLTEDKKVAGINSTVYPDSLINILNGLKDILKPEQIEALIKFFLDRTRQDGIVLEAIGDRQRDSRTFSPETTMGANQLIQSFNLQPQQQQRLEKALNFWARVNTVKFSQTQDNQATTDKKTTTEPEDLDSKQKPEKQKKNKQSEPEEREKVPFDAIDVMDLKVSEPEQPEPGDGDKGTDDESEELVERFKSIVPAYVRGALYNDRRMKLQDIKKTFKGVADIIPLKVFPVKTGEKTRYHIEKLDPFENEDPNQSYDAYAIQFMNKTYLMPNIGKKIKYFNSYFDPIPSENGSFGDDYIITKLPTGFFDGILDTFKMGEGDSGELNFVGTTLNEVKSMIAEIRNIIKQTRRLNEEE